MRMRFAYLGATLGAFVVGTGVWVAPVLRVMGTGYLQLDTAPLARADAMLTSWMLAWGAHALRTDPLAVYDANVFHPLPWTLAFSENLLASALMILPVDVAVGNPTLDHNVLLIASFVLVGTGTALLVRELGAGWPGAWLAGALVAFGPFRYATIGHVHALSTHWMPFALLAIHRCLRRGRGAIAVAVTVLLVAMSSVYYAYFLLLALAVFVPAHRLLGCPAAPGGTVRVLGGIAAAGAGTALLLFPYLIASDVYALRRESGEAWFLAARIVNYLGVVADPIDYLRRRYVLREHGTWLLGLGTLGLAALGALAGAPRGGRRTTALYLVTGTWLALVSMGPLVEWKPLSQRDVPGPWTVLAAVVPGFSALRVSMRACTVALLAAGVLAGLGADALRRRARGRAARATVLALLVGVAVLESWRPRFAVMSVPWAASGVPPVYRWLEAQPGRDAVLELPVGLPLQDVDAMVLSAAHWKPLVNGYSGFTPTMYFFRGLMLGFPSPDAIRLLHAVGVRWIVVHPRRLPPAQAGLCDADLSPHLARPYRDAAGCVLEVLSAPPPPAPVPDRPVSLAGATVATAGGEHPAMLDDARVDAHWAEPVSQTAESWLRLDLPAPHTVSRLVLGLGPHFGEYMRVWRIETSLDGVTWQVAATERNGTPPLVGMRTARDHLTQELRLPAPTPARHLRLVRPGAEGLPPTFDLWNNWTRWGVHEIELYEATP
jgi:hypothetical protein